MTKGWRFEPIRHGLASKGIRTSHSKVQQFHKSEEKVPPKELYPIDYDIISKAYSEHDPPLEKYNKKIKKFIRLFWWSSTHNNWEWFNLNRAYQTIKSLTQNYIIWDLNIKDEKQLEDLLSSEKTPKDVTDENEVIYVEYMDVFVDYLKDLKKDDINENDMISLIDRSIHMQHEMGSLLGGEHISIPELRQEFEEKYL